jgi:TolB-like protein/Flp pilus assembly protein TadD
MAAFLAELKRRNVVKVAAAYAAAAWLVAQVAETVFPVFDLPAQLLRALFILLGLGFPVAVVLAWVYDLTPEGIRRTDDMPADTARVAGRGLDFVIIGCLAVAVIFLVLDRFVWSPPDVASGTSVAVLPFTVRPPDPETGYLGESIADSLVMRLSRLPQLKVKSRSVFGGGPTDLQALGKELGVRAICRGELSRRGGVLEIAVELIDVVDGSILWSDRLTRDFSTLISVESDVSAEIAGALSVELSAEEAAGLARPPTRNAEAYRLYLEGRHFWNQRSQAGLRASAELFRQAVDLDPAYALAWSGLADSYLMLYAWGIEPPQNVATLARAAATRAAELDPALAEPWATIGYFKTLYELDWEGAEDAFLKSIELNENYSTAHHWYAFYLSTVGDSKAAIDEIMKAREAEPLSPVINGEVGIFLVYDGQYRRAIDELEPAQLWNPDFPSLLMSLARAHAMLGNAKIASELFDRLSPYFDDNYVVEGFISIVLPKVGRADEARAVYEQLIMLGETDYVMPAVPGMVAAAIGDNDAAFRHFEEALEKRVLIASWLRDPLIADLAEDPRYGELLERIGVTP